MDTHRERDTERPNVPAGDSKQNYEPEDSLLDVLRRARRPFIVSHRTPDADAIGASLALAAMFREHDTEATVGLTAGRVASKLRFMFDLASEVPRAEQWLADGAHDCLVVLDTAGKKRIDIDPAPDFDGSLPVINIDHHATNTHFARYNWVDPLATSTSELIARLIRRLDRRFSPNIASLLYAGIHADTIGFSLPSTTAESLHIAGELVRAGADVMRIGERLCRSQERGEFELIRRVYDNTQVTDDGQIAYSHLTYQDMTESHCLPDDIDDQVSIPRALRGVRIAMLFSEDEKGVIRVNFRGEGEITVVEIAQQFGGGGHRQSAGTRLHGKTMQEAIHDVLAVAEAHLGSRATS